MIERRPWPDFAESPWKDEPEPPSVFQVALAYPGRAIGNLFFAAIFGLFLTGFFVWVVGLLRGAPVTWFTPAYIVWGMVTAGLWWVGMYGDIHGWWTSGWGE